MVRWDSKNHFANGRPKTDWRKINMNFKENIKTTYKEVTENLKSE